MKCPYCDREYDNERSLKDHINANHWKLLHPNKKGKSGKKKKGR